MKNREKGLLIKYLKDMKEHTREEAKRIENDSILSVYPNVLVREKVFRHGKIEALDDVINLLNACF